MVVRNKRTLIKTRRKTRDIDQIKADLMVTKHLIQYQQTKALEDLPGLGQWYCIECAKWFESKANLVSHERGKPHKKRVRKLREEPYSQKEAEAAVGLTTDKGTRSETGAHDDAPQDADYIMSN